MTYQVDGDFTLPTYKIVLNASSTFLEFVYFEDGDRLEYKSQHGSLGTIYTIKNMRTNKVAKFWEFAVDDFNNFMKNNTTLLG
jgi:hypothetical protein|tara:strand:- start:9128 stop:9376 length:249 start_codon:yes stop_codon:yes gene_type:complete